MLVAVMGLALSFPVCADETESPVRLEQERLGLAGYQARVFYDNRDFGLYTTSSSSRDLGNSIRETTITIWDETIAPLQGKVDLDLVMDLGEAYKDTELARPLTRFLWGGLCLVPGIPLIALADYDDGPPYLGIAFTAVGVVTTVVGGVWKIIYFTAERRYDRYYPQVVAEIESALALPR